MISRNKFFSKHLFAKILHTEGTVGENKSYTNGKKLVATALKFWVEVLAKSHSYGATFAVGYSSNAVVSNK